MHSKTQSPHPVRAILTIAGSDCSSGAGLQADLKTFQYFGLHGLTAVTCIVSETANIVRRVDPVDVDMMEDQIRLMLDSFSLRVVKTGMLGSAAHVRRVAEIFSDHPEIQLVIDPVMVASTGASLLEPEAVEIYQTQLLPLAHVITPNLPEAEVLLGRKIASFNEMETSARELAEKYGCAVLLKGGHLPGPECVDLLVENPTIHRFFSPRLSVSASHGTGCTLAASVASGLAIGKSLPESVADAKTYLDHCLFTSYSLEAPNGEMIHALNQGTLHGNQSSCGETANERK